MRHHRQNADVRSRPAEAVGLDDCESAHAVKLRLLIEGGVEIGQERQPRLGRSFMRHNQAQPVPTSTGPAKRDAKWLKARGAEGGPLRHPTSSRLARRVLLPKRASHSPTANSRAARRRVAAACWESPAIRRAARRCERAISCLTRLLHELQYRNAEKIALP